MVASQITLIPTPPMDEMTLTDLSDPEDGVDDEADGEKDGVDDEADGGNSGDTRRKRAAGVRSSGRLDKKAKTGEE
jgi:hypothetical protein